jgi:1-acyl-sn-glycerol-3-phosphate acyltransferase
VRLALRILHAGAVVGIFPEGQRGDGLAATAKPGVGYLALRTDAAVVPVAWQGTDVLTRRRTVRRPAARVTFGAPVHVGHVPTGQLVNRRRVLAATEEIRSALADLVATTILSEPRRLAA